VLAELDPDPIGSASVACVYRGRRLDGRPVALKLRRRGVRRAFASDLAVLGVVVRVADATALVRSGLFTPLLDDLRQVLSEEASFRTEARYQRAFRRTLRRDRVRGVRAPAVHSDLCTDALLVTDLIEAVPLSTLLVAVESGDRATLARLEGQGITPGRVARRLAEFSLWVRFEAPFFHADPHAGNLFVDPDSALVLVDFGACGRTSTRTRRHHLEVLRHLVDPDPSASARIMLSDLSPLPRLDRDGFEGEMAQRFHGLALAMRDRDAHWSERIVVSVWLAMLEVARRYELRVNLDTVRSIRAVLLYDTLSFRLDGRMGLGVLRRYLHQLDVRRARARPATTPPPRLPQASLDSRVQQLEAASVTRHQVQRFTRASVHLARAVLGAVQLLAAGVVVFGALTWLGASPAGPLTLVVLAASVAITLTTLSRTLTLLDRAEP
jgi:predicted unusual protein kinase regulating ubiquinone biosynthesis (AarF/ABC1/UbiB family)